MGLQRHNRLAPRAAGLAVGAAALLVGAAGAAYAFGAPQSETTGSALNTPIDVDLADAPLTVATKLIMQRTGINLVIMSSTQPYGTVTLSVRRKPARDVLDLIARSAGADLWQDDAGVYYIGPKGSAPKAARAEPEPVGLPGLDPNNPNPTGPVRYEKIKLSYAEPNTVLHQLGALNNPMGTFEDQLTYNVLKTMLAVEDPTGGQQYGKPMAQTPLLLPDYGYGPRQIAPAAPSVPPGTVPFNLGVQQPGSASPQSLSQPAIGTSGSAGDQSAQRDGGQDRSEFGRALQFGGGGGFGGQGGGFGGGGFGGGGQGGGFGGGGQGGGFGGQGGGGLGGAGAGGAGVASGLLPRGIVPGDLYAYDADGSIIVRYTDPAALRQLRDIIRLLDVKPRQIMIRAEFVTVTQNDVNSFGINWSFQKVNLIGGINTGYSASSTAFLQFATGNLQTQLSWILTTGHGKLVAAPMATTLNNVAVSFTALELVPIFLSSPIALGTGTVILSDTIVPFPVTTGLAILPRINGDDSITLNGAAFVSDILGTETGPDGESFPLVSEEVAPVRRIIRSGDTMVVAGLLRKQDLVSTNKVPLLGDLPLIGNLFKSRSVTTNDAELLVFITPSIIPERVPLGALGGGVGGGTLAGPAGPVAGPGGGLGGTTP